MKTSFASLPMITAVGSVKFDFDGDGKADIARWQAASTEWKVKNSSNGSFSTNLIGSAASTIAPAEYDGDAKTDSAVFNPSAGTWTIRRSSNGTTNTITGFGQAGDKAVAGDYDGDGLADAAVWRASNGTWYVRQSSNGAVVSFQFGSTGDIPVAGNYDGDSRMDYAVFRPSTGYWYVWFSSTNNYSGWNWGLASDIPVPADYDGDGKTDYAVYRGSSGTWWYCKSSTNNSVYLTQNWGNYGDQPTPADYDGDGKADYAVWRPTTGVWHIIKSSDGGYDYQTLGVSGDIAVPSAYVQQIGGQVLASDLAKARLSPKNATGGTNLYSRNFSWGTGLVGLAGRAGLDAGFGVSYNSLVWTKQANTMVFDADNSNVAPGFRFGFPTIEPSYYDSQTGKFNYLMVTPSGARVEFKQTAASNIYETADSSYVQLKTIGAVNPNEAVENITLTVVGTDGRQLSYGWKAGAFRCLQIKDANGNFISINHDETGLLRTVTDTLGRVVTVNYDNQLYPVSITQNWQTGNGSGATTPYTWATFAYTNMTINTNFGSLAVYGPPGGTSLKVLSRITSSSGSSTQFDYNAYGQVWRVRNHAADNHELNHIAVNLESVSQVQTDCPRFSETRSYVENFNNNQEVVVSNSIQENQPYNVGGISGTGTLLQVSLVGHPNQAVSKTYIGGSGWREGLPQATEDWADGSRQRWTWSNWTQDDPTKTYIVNPRVIETKVGDAANTKRTTVDYYPTSQGSPVALYGLVKEVKLYDANQTTVLKRATSEYNLDSAYTTRRIIGLPSKSELFDENGFLTAKVTYNYDEENFAQEPEQNISPLNHDTLGFGTSFIIGRGNQTSTTRWDVNFPDNSSQAVVERVRYDVAGSPVAQIDALNRKVKINYTDAFNDNQTRNSFAYPTKLTDAAGNFSEVKYRFDIGANVWAKSPAPQNQTSGKITERLFDSIGRLSRETLLNNGAYTRYEYPTSQIQAKVYSTIVDINNNGADANDEVLAESWTDGAGRVRQSRTELPNSTGGFSGSLVEYDILGRVNRSTIPTEIDANWNPSGDDVSRGFLWTSQEYDWKGRVTRTINTDGTDTIASYDGCGCAGGQITTVKGENIVETDWQGNNPNTLGRRTQKIYADIQGRTYKTQVMNWDGVTPYSTTLVQFNGRDQTVSVKQYDGTETSQIFQETTQTYDGHGRLKTQHRPEQNIGTVTTYNYNADDSISSMMDARGASTNYTYMDARGLLTNITYAVPSASNISVPSPVAFGYDNAGNIIQMNDETGTTTYQYSQLSQIASETKQFSGITSSFTLSYQYGLSGQLKTVNNPGGTSTSYVFDKIGRLTAVNGQNFSHKAVYWNGSTQTTTTYNINQIIQAIQYRAWGGIKQAEFPDGRQYNITYNNKLLPEEYKIPGKLEKRYTYTADGNLSFAQDLLDNRSDRSFSNDNVGRMTTAYSGYVARGEPRNNNSPNGYEWFVPYKNNYSYNAFNNPVSRTETGSFLPENTSTLSKNYTNNRADGWIYDADGRFIEEPGAFGRSNKFEFNAAGQASKTTVDDVNTLDRKTSFYDGNGMPVKETMLIRYTNYDTNGNPLPDLAEETSDRYYLRSTVLGGAVVCLIYENGIVGLTNVYAGGKKVATYLPNDNFNSKFTWEHTDSNGVSGYRSSFDSMEPVLPNEDLVLPGKTEYDPHGQEMGGLPTMSEITSGGGGGGGSYQEAGGEWETFDCIWDGVNVPCAWIRNRQQNSGGGGGSLIEAPPDQVAAIWSNSQNRYVGLAVWNPAAAERGIAFLGRNSLGWLPTNVSYTPGSGLSGDNVYQWFGGFPGGRLGSGAGNPNFISESSTQLHSMLQGIKLNGANFQDQQRQTQPTPLSGKDLKKFQSERDRLLKLLSFIGDKAKSACRKFLEKAGFDVNKIRENLLQQTPYDADASTNDATIEFKFYDPSTTNTVKDFFASEPGALAGTGYSGKIYYRSAGVSLSTILHENLHSTFKGNEKWRIYDPKSKEWDGLRTIGVSPLTDTEIQGRLGIDVSNSTTNIDDKLAKEGCK